MESRRRDNNCHLKNYLICDLHGFKNVTINNNVNYRIDSDIIKFIRIDDNFKNMYVELQDNITYKEYEREISNYLYHICFNLIVRTDIHYIIPFYSINTICENSEKITRKDTVHIRDSLELKYNVNSNTLYNNIVNSQTSIDDNFMKYERMFKTLHNPNNIAQFMSLYQFLMELLQENRTYTSQKLVTNYLKRNKDKYDFLYFKPTRKINENFEEDCFTYIRNEIGHSEDTNDLNLYKELGSQITQQLIKNLLIVINDIIIDS